MYKLISKNKHHFSIVLYVVVFIVCFALAISLLAGKRNPLLPSNRAASMNMADSAWMKLETSDAQVKYQVGDQVTVFVKGDSRGVELTGYDALIGFDPAAVEIISVSSVKETIDIYPHQNADYVSVTGVKRITEDSQVIFHNDSLMSVVLRVKAPGATSLTIIPQKGNERTKIVDTSAQIIIPQVGEALTLNVQ